MRVVHSIFVSLQLVQSPEHHSEAFRVVEPGDIWIGLVLHILTQRRVVAPAEGSPDSNKDVIAGCHSRLDREEKSRLRIADDIGREDSAEAKHTIRARDSAKTRRKPSTQPEPETLRRLGGESCVMLPDLIVFNLTRSIEWWHRRDQARIPRRTLSPTAFSF